MTGKAHTMMGQGGGGRVTLEVTKQTLNRNEGRPTLRIFCMPYLRGPSMSRANCVSTSLLSDWHIAAVAFRGSSRLLAHVSLHPKTLPCPHLCIFTVIHPLMFAHFFFCLIGNRVLHL